MKWLLVFGNFPSNPSAAIADEDERMECGDVYFTRPPHACHVLTGNVARTIHLGVGVCMCVTVEIGETEECYLPRADRIIKWCAAGGEKLFHGCCDAIRITFKWVQHSWSYQHIKTTTTSSRMNRETKPNKKKFKRKSFWKFQMLSDAQCQLDPIDECEINVCRVYDFVLGN